MPKANAKGKRSAGAGRRALAWLGLLPFLLFAAAFMLLPAGSLLAGSFFNAAGAFTLDNFAHLLRPSILGSYAITIRLAAASAFWGSILGLLIAYAAVLGGLPKGLRSFVSTFSGVASNFAGVPLAFAFIATLGRVGIVTVVLRELLGVDLYASGFSLYGFWGLCLAYVYFQAPLMVLIIEPALLAMKQEWREASENLGASTLQYWTRVGLPVLAPSILAAFILLFGNAFGAYATAYALTGGMLNLTPIMIGAQIRGDVLHDPNLGYALALGMVLVMGLAIAAYTWLRGISSRWVK
jgi:putative spermidine/putrescine transport system permease protein